jgi:DNA polymerase-1
MIKTDKLLIDGDLILYRCSSATEYTVQWDEDNFVMASSLSESQELVVQAVAELRSVIDADHVVVCLSDKANFRKDLTPDYKANRKSIRKPMVYPELRAWFEKTYDVVVFPNMEADDALGILATHPDNLGKTIIASEDKDLQTIMGLLYRQGELKTISPNDADRYWMQQTLTGDPTDGYKGCAGIGEKKAESILGVAQTLETMWSNVVNAYRKAGMTYEDALLNARLARILRHEDYIDQKIKLWEP